MKQVTTVRRMLTCLLISLTLATGCGTRETDELVFVLAIGFDEAENGQIKVTYQMAIPRTLGKSEGGGGNGGGNKATIISTVVAPSVSEARNELMSTISRIPNQNHIKAMLISEKLARSGIEKILAPAERFKEWRETIPLIIVKGSAEEFMTKNEPKLEQTPSKFYETLLLKAPENSYYLRVEVHDFNTRIKNFGGSPYATYAAISPMKASPLPDATTRPQQQAGEYTAGQVPRSGNENPIDFAGTAMFHGAKMVGVLNNTETRMLAIVLNKFTHSPLVVTDPLSPDQKIALNIRPAKKTKVAVSVSGEQQFIRVQAFLEADLISIHSGINYEAAEYKKLVENQVSNVIKEQLLDMIKHTQEVNSDVCGFGLFLRPLCDTFDQVQQVDFTYLFPNAKVEVEVQTKLRRSGLLWKTTRIIEQ